MILGCRMVGEVVATGRGEEFHMGAANGENDKLVDEDILQHFQDMRVEIWPSAL